MRRSELIFGVVVTVIASGTASVVAAHITRSAHRPDNIEARSVTIVDEANRPVAVLSSTRGAPELALFDQQRQKRVVLFLEENGTPDLYLNDAAGNTRAALDLYDSGHPNLEFVGASGSVDGRPQNPLALVLESTKEGGFRFAFRDFQTWKMAGELEFRTELTGPRVELMDNSGKTIWSTDTKR